MNGPPDYLTFEERQEERRAINVIDSMVAPSVSDAIDLMNQ
jgi:hypothetical protein